MNNQQELEEMQAEHPEVNLILDEKKEQIVQQFPPEKQEEARGHLGL